MKSRLWAGVLLFACASGQAFAASDQLVPEGCVILSKPRKVSSECGFKKNTAMFYTPIKTSGAQGCPKSLIVLYRDPQTGKILSHAALRQNTVIETCTAGVSRVAIKPGQAIIRSDKDSRKPLGKNKPSGRLDGVTISYSYSACTSTVCTPASGVIKLSGNTLIWEGGGVRKSLPIGGQFLEGRTESSHGCKTRFDDTYEVSANASQVVARSSTKWSSTCSGTRSEGRSGSLHLVRVDGNKCDIRVSWDGDQTNYDADGKVRKFPNGSLRMTNPRCTFR